MTTVTVAYFLTNKSQLDAQSGGFVVADAATAVVGSLASLAADPNLSAIVLTGGSASTAAAFSIGHAGRLDLGTSALTLAGSATFPTGAAASTTIVGAAGGTLTTNGATAVGALVLGGTALWINGGTVTQSGQVQIGDGSGAAEFLNTASGTYDVAGDFGIGTAAGTAASLVNQGLLAKTSGTGVSHIAVNVVDTGTLSVAGGNLRFDGAQNSFAGTYIGPGMIDYGVGSTASLGTIAMTYGACTTNFGTVNQSGTLTLGDGSTLTNLAIASWNLVGDVGIALAPGSSLPVFTNKGLLAKISGSGTSVVAMNVTGAGAIAVASGTLSFTGPVTAFGGAIGGAGSFSIGGGTGTIGVGATITTTAFSIAGTASVTLAEALAYAGSFSEAGGASLALGGNILTLSGAGVLSGSLTGSGTLAVSGTTEIAGSVGAGVGLSVGSGGSVRLDHSVSGGTLTFGAGRGTVTVASGATIGDTVSGFALGDAVDFAGIAFSSANRAVFTAAAGGGTVSIVDTAHGNAVLASLTLSGSYTTGEPTLGTDGAGGTVLRYAPKAPVHDFNADGTSDILWQQTGGAVYDWGMVGGQHTANTTVAAPGALPTAQWALIGTGDFNGDNTGDLLWQYRPTGVVYEWDMQNGTMMSQVTLGTLTSSQYQLIGTGDFTGHGTDDLLWQDQTNGAVYEWGMTNGQHTSDTTLANPGALPLSQWAMIGKGDFNGDGTTDLLWQNKQSGAVYEWGMQNGQHTADISLGTVALSQYALIGTGDFNGDGTTDLLWQDKGSGAVYDWGMTNGQHTSDTFIGTVPTSQWSLLTTGDFNGDGTTDLLWQGKQSGSLYVWGMQNAHHATDTALGTLSPTDWHTPSSLTV